MINNYHYVYSLVDNLSKREYNRNIECTTEGAYIMKCLNCGAEMPDNVNYCMTCGTKLNAIQSEEDVVEQTVKKNSEQNAEEQVNGTVESTDTHRNTEPPITSSYQYQQNYSNTPYNYYNNAKEKTKKRKKRIFISVALIIALVFLGSMFGCIHDWQDATCTKPKTCSKCGEIKGNALGHIPGEMKIEKEPTIFSDGKKVKRCTRCDEILSTETTHLESFVKNGKFIFTPNEFSIILGNKLNNIGGCELTSKCAVMPDNTLGVGVIAPSRNSVAVMMFSDKNGLLNGNSKNSANISSILCKTFSKNGKEVAATTLGVVWACDPTLSFESAKQLCIEIAKSNDNIITRNGIKYGMVPYKGDLVLMITPA